MATTLLPERPPEPPLDVAVEVAAGADDQSRIQRFVRGRPDDSAWVRPSLLALLAATALLYLWGLGASGWANSFYSAAVQAGSKSWKAFFFGSSDAANSITVDKTPASLWVMDLSARIFGVNSWSILVPQALEGVAAVGLLYAAVRRWFSPAAALLAGLVLATTPAAASMFRFNNPDALLVLLLTAGAYATVRALESASTKWLLIAWSCVGLGFLSKMLQAFLVAPAFALVYLIAAPTSLRRRIGQLFVAGIAMIVSAGWWVAAVELWPKASRPYIGGSQNNSMLNLIFGYNGFGRLTGDETGSVGGGGRNGVGRWGATGWNRLFNTDFGGEISWLIPAALILLVAGLLWRWRAPRTDRTRAALMLWGGWLMVTALVFSYSKGIIHPYYSVALGPAIGGVIGIGAVALWQQRRSVLARVALALSLAAAVVWSAKLLGRLPSWHPELRTLILVPGLLLGLAFVLWPRWHGRADVGVAAAAITLALLGPGAYTLATAATAHSGAIPSTGPASAAALGRGGPGRLPGGFGGAPGGQPPRGQTGGVNAIGGLLNGSKPSAELVAVLEQNRDHYRWIAAAIGSNQASGYQLATGDPVMPIGGFNGTDPSPTLAQFRQWVADGKIHYFISSGGGFGGARGGPGGGPGGAGNVSSAISSWVTSHFKSQTVGGVTLYDLTAPVA